MSGKQITGFLLVAIVLLWLFSFMVRDLGWKKAIFALAFSVGVTGTLAVGVMLATGDL